VENDSPSDFNNALDCQLQYWQKLLKLQDWEIKTVIWPHDALDGHVSRITWSRNQKTATLVVRHPNDIPPVERDWPENEALDYDISILHELLHLKCVEMESKVEWAEEQVVNHVSRAMVKLYREVHPTKEIPEKHQVGHYV